MSKLALCLVALGLAACAEIDTARTVAAGLERVRGGADALLARKIEAELELMRESDDLARLLREEAARFERAKCHAGLPALRAFADASESNRAALSRHCGLEVEPGAARLGTE